MELQSRSLGLRFNQDFSTSRRPSIHQISLEQVPLHFYFGKSVLPVIWLLPPFLAVCIKEAIFNCSATPDLKPFCAFSRYAHWKYSPAPVLQNSVTNTFKQHEVIGKSNANSTKRWKNCFFLLAPEGNKFLAFVPTQSKIFRCIAVTCSLRCFDKMVWGAETLHLYKKFNF